MFYVTFITTTNSVIRDVAVLHRDSVINWFKVVTERGRRNSLEQSSKKQENQPISLAHAGFETILRPEVLVY